MDATHAMSAASSYQVDRAFLRFAEEVKARFSYLEIRGYRCLRSEPTFVRFESSEIAINVYHGRRSYEIGLEIESVHSPIARYSFPEILRLVDQRQAEQYTYYATHTLQGVAEGVCRLAQSFHFCIDAGVLDDTQIFNRLEVQGKELVRNFALEVELEQARRKSEEAWRTKDYAAVVKALKPLRAALTATEVRKVEFAEKQLERNSAS